MNRFIIAVLPAIFGEVQCRSSTLGEVKYFESAEMTKELFESLMLNGEVAVIRGASSFWPLASWSCEQFRKSPHMKGFQVERVYGENDGTFVPLCPSCDEWENDRRSSDNDDRDGPKYAPLYWDVRGNKASVEVIDGLTPPWPFLSKSNHFWKRNVVELWFSPPEAGAKYHIDSHVQATAISQLVGTRRWRLALVPKEDHAGLIPDHLDSNTFDWTPDITVTLNNGDLLLFPPGTIHDTLNLGESCAVSVTHQLGVPYPALFFRAQLRRLLRLADTRETWPVIADLASYGFLRPRLTSIAPFFESDEEFAQAMPQELRYNESDSGKFFGYVYDMYVKRGVTGPFAERRNREYLGYHDTNKDGGVSKAEFIEGATEWLLVESEILNSIPQKFRPVRFFMEDMEKSIPSAMYWGELKLRQKHGWAPLNATVTTETRVQDMKKSSIESVRDEL